MNNDLISRNKLIENLPQPIGEKEAIYYIKVVKAIDNTLIVEERPQGEWVPVSERLPEKNGYYLVTRKGFSMKNHVKRVGYDANAKRWSEGSIIAWQELPEPYKEGGAKE